MEEFCHAFDNPRIKNYYQMGWMLAENVRTSLSPYLLFARSAMNPVLRILGDVLNFKFASMMWSVMFSGENANGLIFV